MVTKVKLESIDRLRVGHLVTWDWQMPTQRAAEVVEERIQDGVRTLTLRDRAGRRISVTNETIRAFDLSVPEDWNPRPAAASAARHEDAAASQAGRFRSRRRAVRAVQNRSDQRSAIAILRFVRRHAAHLVLEPTILEPTAGRPFERIALRDPETGVLAVALTTGRLELLPGDWLVWRDQQLTVVTEQAFRDGYEAA